MELISLGGLVYYKGHLIEPKDTILISQILSSEKKELYELDKIPDKKPYTPSFVEIVLSRSISDLLYFGWKGFFIHSQSGTDEEIAEAHAFLRYNADRFNTMCEGKQLKIGPSTDYLATVLDCSEYMPLKYEDKSGLLFVPSTSRGSWHEVNFDLEKRMDEMRLKQAREKFIVH